MKILQIDKKRDVFLISGMFAGGWLWETTSPKIDYTSAHVLNDPLCGIGDSLNIITEKLVAAIKDLNTPVTLISNSLGSLICLKIAIAIPRSIKRVIISGSAGFNPVRLDGFKITPKQPNEMANQIAGMVFSNTSVITLDKSLKAAECFKDRSQFRSILRLTKESNLVSASDLLNQVACPVVAIWGDEDRITPFPHATAILKEFDVSTHVIPKCGHSPMYERPDEFASIVNEYLN